MEQINPGSYVAALAGIMFVFLGLMQYISTFMKSQDKRRQEIFKELETARLELLETRAERDKWKLRYYQKAEAFDELYKAADAIQKENALLKRDLRTETPLNVSVVPPK